MSIGVHMFIESAYLTFNELSSIKWVAIGCMTHALGQHVGTKLKKIENKSNSLEKVSTLYYSFFGLKC